MALVLQDPGMRENTGAQQLSAQLQGYGQQAIADREQAGQLGMQQVSDYAQSRGISLAQAMEENPSLAQTAYSSLMGLTKGDRGMADNMFATMQQSKPTRDQMFNYQVNKVLDGVDPNMPAFDTQKTTELVRSPAYQKTVPDIKLDEATIAQIALDAGDKSLWTPIAEYVGMTPVGGTAEAPVWGEDFNKLRDDILQHYVGKSLNEFRSAPPTEKANLSQALKANMASGKVLTEALTDGTIQYELSGDTMDSIPGQQIERLDAVPPAGGVNPVTGMNQQQGLHQWTVTPKGTTPETPAETPIPSSAPPEEVKTFYESGSKVIDVPAVTENVTETVKGWFSTTAELEDKIRTQGQEAAQRSIISDVALRDAEATIRSKDAQTRLMGAQYMSSLAQLQAMEEGGQMSEAQKTSASIAQTLSTDMFKAQLNKDWAKTMETEEDLKAWNTMVENLVTTWDNLGFDMQLAEYVGKDRWWRDDLKVYNVGGVTPKTGVGTTDLSGEDLNAYLQQFQQ